MLTDIEKKHLNYLTPIINKNSQVNNNIQELLQHEKEHV